LTLPQLHAVVNTLIDSLDLTPEAREERLARAARKMHHWQLRNAQARASHTRTRYRVLEQLGYQVDELPRCAPG
jgi:hypothetical protein